MQNQSPKIAKDRQRSPKPRMAMGSKNNVKQSRSLKPRVVLTWLLLALLLLLDFFWGGEGGGSWRGSYGVKTLYPWTSKQVANGCSSTPKWSHRLWLAISSQPAPRSPPRSPGQRLGPGLPHPAAAEGQLQAPQASGQVPRQHRRALAAHGAPPRGRRSRVGRGQTWLTLEGEQKKKKTNSS